MYLIGLVPFSVTLIVQRVFLALQDTRTPFFLQTGQAAITAIGLLFVMFAPTDSIAALVALTISVANWIVAIVSIAIAKRRVRELGVGRIAGRFGWYLLAMIPAAAAGLGMSFGISASGLASSSLWWSALLACLVIGVVMLVVYAVALWLSRNPEIRAVLGPVPARLRPRPE